MIKRNEMTAYLQEFLACHLYQDYAPNGLQIEGADDIQSICTAVTASRDVIEQTAQLGAEALFVHHGYFWRGESPVISGMKRKRIGSLLSSDINLFAYHLPLDCHPTLGNNACIGSQLALKKDTIKGHTINNNANLLWSGAFSEGQSAEALMESLEQLFQKKPIHIGASQNKPIHRIAWCSGAAQDFIEEAHALGVDAYVSGEVSERTYYQAKEMGIHYFACGHHATERFGIRALGEHLAHKFSLKHHFIDSDNPV